MPDLRKVYKAIPGATEGAKIPSTWKIAQLRTVTPDTPFGWNQWTTHLTIETWDKSVTNNTQRIKKFHLSFKAWQGKTMAQRGEKQPGCNWEWSPALTKFDFKGWYEVPSLYLKAGEDVKIAEAANKFVRKYVDDLLLDKFMWASLGDATRP